MPIAGSSLAADDVIRVPMRLEGVCYVVDYMIGSTLITGVVDSGSPHLTTLADSDTRSSGYNDTYAVYGVGKDRVVKWVLGDTSFSGDRLQSPVQIKSTQSESRASSSAVLQLASGSGDGAGATGGPTSFAFPGLLLGVTSKKTKTSPGPLVGLVKYRADFIRPTFLGQTDITSFQIDYESSALLLSRKPLLPPGFPGTLKMVDLRFLGAPVFHYAVKVQQLFVNGQLFTAADRPIYAVFDSGTSGLMVNRDLFDAAEFELGVLEVEMRFKAEDGSKVVVSSSRRICKNKCLFLCLPIDIPWAGVPQKAHVIFVGVAFLLNQGKITIDADAGRLLLGG
eukprot:gnl/TRDRNA2_/TRDRNA2_110911_c1_seq1.p1 gnl/TRDRNA2_/TRDRNA2_110911_c1~~gnl/TRDRNA2_/TRDRNA2_110911_c1_seq1.p1  ORF type:complete len:394 (-),score=45.18 gnl/TRDRNA2_/TRDRNA2_110911_c1_seq1:62-1075(-)